MSLLDAIAQRQASASAPAIPIERLAALGLPDDERAVLVALISRSLVVAELATQTRIGPRRLQAVLDELRRRGLVDVVDRADGKRASLVWGLHALAGDRLGLPVNRWMEGR